LEDVVHESARIRPEGASQGADNPGGYAGLKAVWISNRNRHLTDANILRFPETHRPKLGRIDTNDGQIGIRILANKVSVWATSIGEDYLDFVGTVDDVAVRKDEAVVGDEKSRATAGPLAIPLANFNVHNRRANLVGGMDDGL
jgi:hypothetical protein